MSYLSHFFEDKIPNVLFGLTALISGSNAYLLPTINIQTPLLLYSLTCDIMILRASIHTIYQ